MAADTGREGRSPRRASRYFFLLQHVRVRAAHGGIGLLRAGPERDRDVSAHAFWLSHTVLKNGLAAAFFSKFFIAAAPYSLK